MKPNRYGSSRQHGTREPLPVVIIVCDDAKTAVAYFNEVKNAVRAKVALKVVGAPRHGATADAVVACAIEEMGDLNRDNSGEPADAVWALIDLEAEPEKQRQAGEAKKKAESAGVRVALSNPCFEVWTLAHLVDTGEAFLDCNAVVRRLKVEWNATFGTEFGKKKAQADYSKLMELRQEATKRCKKHRNDRSWSEVYKIVANIDKLC